MAESPSNQAIVADTFDDNDSAAAVSVGSSLESLRSSILQSQEENGRTYHAFKAGKYNFPNDSGEAERLEIQHYVFNLTLNGALGICPKATEGASRVLDLGTGTGCWAIDYADAFPAAEVIGVDLSAIQPSLVPPNCSFEIDDLEQDWTWGQKFDFIMGRCICGSFATFEELFKKAYDALEPGGWFETQDLVFPWGCDDGSLDPESELAKLSHFCVEASKALGRPLDVTPSFKGIMEKVGFQNVTEQSFKWPVGPWPRDTRYKEIGSGMLVNLDTGLEGLLMALFTRGLKWSREETLTYCAATRRQMRNRSNHAFIPILMVQGQKPLEDEK